MDRPPESSSAAATPAAVGSPISPPVADLTALSEKLDILSVQVGYLIERAQADARRQQERAELLHDVLPIANDAVGIVTEQLAEIQEYVDLSDLLRLFKRVMRSGRNIDRMLDQLESLMDLAQTVGPLSTSIFDKVTDQLELAEQRGYFALAKGGARAVDRVAASLTPEDMDRFADNLAVILTAFKEWDQPAAPGMRSLLKQVRDPEVQRGLAATLRVLRVVGVQSHTTQAPADGGIAAKTA